MAIVPVEQRKMQALVTAGFTEEQLAALTPEDREALVQTILEDQQILKSETVLKPARWGIVHKHQKFVNDDGETFPEMEAIIVFHHQTRGLWNEGDKVPLCSALLASKGVGFARQDTNMEWAGGEHICATCRFNEWGSDPKGGRGKACKEMQRLFLKVVNPQTPELTPVMFNVPPTSLDAFYNFTSTLRRRGQSLVATTVVFTLKKAEGQGQVYSEVEFHPGRKLTPQEVLEAGRLRAEFERIVQMLGLEIGDYMSEAAPPGEVGTEEPAPATEQPEPPAQPATQTASPTQGRGAADDNPFAGPGTIGAGADVDTNF